ncbi:MAG: hypothetical protein IIA87_02015 [Nanoarchaeota archaeon]|nr:hypothetical protein [Nanoarchaeota archaeon]
MKKVGIIFLVLFFAVPIVIAQESNETNNLDNIEKAYQCLRDQIDDKETSSLSLGEAIFSTLALGKQEKLEDRIEQDKKGECWPKPTCKLKETAQVLLAYDSINKDTDEIESWLISKNDSSTELTWFLQIDIQQHVPATCTLKYKGVDRTINIGEDMKLTGNPGTCFSVTSTGFWLKIQNSCLDETFQISCDQDFITSLLYQKQGSSTIFISPETHSASSSGTTEEEVSAKCFKTGSSCDYEGSLWAAVALEKAGQDASAFAPYLLALAEDNKKLFPATFLFILTDGNDQFSEIVQSQKQEKFWQAPTSKYNKFYDTALALLALQGESSIESDDAKSYLLEIQTPKGCWNNNNIKDTAFLLYAGWPEEITGGVILPGSGPGLESCESAGYSCEARFSCLEAEGTILENYDCPGLKKCCSVTIQELTCAERTGIICASNEECSGTVVSTPSEGSCCLASCQKIREENACVRLGGICASSCNLDNEEVTSDSCTDTSLICCISKTESTTKISSSTWIWIILLSVLIILVVLGIIYRNKLRLFLFKFKGRKRRPPVPGARRPPFPPAYGPPIRRIPQRTSPPVRRPASKTDKELDETLKKLREMSK